jgi:hypothetical protein
MYAFFRTSLLAALLLAGAPAAQAAVQTYDFGGTLDSGFYLGASFSGSFSFDDATLLGTGPEWLNVSSLFMSFLGNSYTEADADVGTVAEVGFLDGAFLGLSYSVSSGDPRFSVIAGSFDPSDAYLAYDTALGNSGSGSIAYAQVPEPATYALLLAGLAGFMAFRRRA